MPRALAAAWGAGGALTGQSGSLRETYSRTSPVGPRKDRGGEGRALDLSRSQWRQP